jgi:pimeloyl-ACP methyl ester carboxylesterase
MQNLVMIPAMGCDGRLYAELIEALVPVVAVTVIVADGDNLSDCVRQVLEQTPGKFIVLGTSFGGRVALETVLAAPDRV